MASASQGPANHSLGGVWVALGSDGVLAWVGRKFHYAAAYRVNVAVAAAA